MLTRRHVVLMAGTTVAMVGAASALAQGRMQGPIQVVATFSVLGDLVKNVGGDRVNVIALVGPNGDIHVYSPTPADARAIATARAVVVNGLGLEAWLDRLIAVSGAAPVIVASAGINPRHTARDAARGRGSDQTTIDPHAWQSVANAEIYVANIRDGLSRADPAGKDSYDANARSYLAKLDALETEVRQAIGKIPADRRKIITTHAAFGYFGDKYGIEFIAPEGITTDVAPSVQDVAAIIAQVKRQKIPAVFIENITDPRLMRQIASETGATIGGTLYSDALSGPDGPASTYIDMMRHNIGEFDKALIGAAAIDRQDSEAIAHIGGSAIE